MVKQRSGRVNADHSYKGSDPHQKSLLPFLRWILRRHAALGGITEIRAIAEKPSKMIWSGYFDDKQIKLLVDLLLPDDDGPRPKLRFGEVPVIGEANFYFTMQPVNPALLARSAYEFGRCQATSDQDIVAYTLFAVDVDPVRPSGICATKAEKKEAQKVCQAVSRWFSERKIKGFGADSGNGYHLLIPTITYKDVAQASANAQALLQLLDQKFSNAQAKVDTTIYNPGRILKLYGTLAMKGSSIKERPHRFAEVWTDNIPEDVDLFGILGDELAAFKKEAAATKSAPAAGKNAKVTTTKEGSKSAPRERSGGGWDAETAVKIMTGVLDRAELSYRIKKKQGDHFFEFENCPHHTDPDGDTYECCVIVRADGSLAAKCQHDAEATWKEHFKPVIGWDEHADGVKDELGIKRSTIPYKPTPHGIVHLKMTANDVVQVPLTNFTARIVNEVAEDDGAEVRRRFEIEAHVKNRQKTLTLPADEFAAMNWPINYLGGSAVVSPGLGNKDHARAAIQLLSGDIPTQTVYTHLGWRQHGDQHVYLHAGGAIGPKGAVAGLRVHLEQPFTRYLLLEPPSEKDLVRAVRASMRLLDLAPVEITVPLFGAIWRAVAGGTDFSIHLVGPTGVFKSALAALVQQHWGAQLDARHLPANWSSTANTNEALAFIAKDAVLTVDDFAPPPSKHDADRLHRDADRLLRGQGNQAGRGRMRADTTLRPPRLPRGLIVSTGEDIPRGQSLRARILVVNLSNGDIDKGLLTKRQKDADAGLYAMALWGFVRWLAGHHDNLRQRWLPEGLPKWRDCASSSEQHARTPPLVADLYLGIRMFAYFAKAIGIFDSTQTEELAERGWEALGKAASRQAALQAGGEPVQRFLTLLAAALAAGKAHVANARGERPNNAKAWGWRQQEARSESEAKWEPRGDCIGWTDGRNLYLQPEAAFNAAQEMGRNSEALAISSQTLRRRLAEKQMLASTDKTRDRLMIRKVLAGTERNVLHLRADALKNA